MEIRQVSHHRLSVTIEGERYLGLRTGVPGRGFAAQRVSAAARSGATLIRGARFEPWPVRRVITHDGELFLLVDELPGESLSEALYAATGNGLATASGDPSQTTPRGKSVGPGTVGPGTVGPGTVGPGTPAPPERNASEPDSRSPKTVPAWLPGFLRSTESLARHDDLSLCNTMTSLVTPDGAVLVLSAGLSHAIGVNLPAPFRRVASAPYRPERREDADLQRYTALTIAYHALCGRPLCAQDDPTRTARCHASALEKAPVHYHAPSIRAGIAELLDRAIGSADNRNDGILEQLADLVEAAPLHEDIDQAEHDRRRTQATERLERNRNAVQRRRFWQRHGRTVVLAAVASAVLLAVPVTVIRNALQPPATAGMGPREVAETFYRAWNDLDHILMEDTVGRGVARDVIREITNVYVIDRVQMARQWESLLMPAPEWMTAGRPGERVPYGVNNLQLELARQGSAGATVRARYEMWRPDSVQQPDGSFLPMAVRTDVDEVLELVPTDWGWEISGISTRVGEPEVVELGMEAVR